MKSKIIEVDKKYQIPISWKYFTQEISDSNFNWFSTKEHVVIQKAKYVQIDFYPDGKLFNWNILDEDKVTISTKHCEEKFVNTIYNEIVLSNI